MNARSKLSCLMTGLAVAVMVSSSAAEAREIRVGLTGTFTGVNSTAGIPHRQVSEIFPNTLGGLPVRWIVLDDATDPTMAVKNARKFVDEDQVDVIVGSSSIITSLPIFDVAARSGTPQLALSPVPLPQDKRQWLFNIAQPLDLMIEGIVQDMKKRGIERVAFIGFSDGWGDQNLTALTALLKDAGIKLVATQRYARTDASVTAQIINIMSSDAQAIYIGGAGTASALPHIALKDQGFEGPIYHSHGAVSQTFIDTGGSSIEGAILPTSPMVVAGDLPDSHPSKASALDFIRKFQAKWGNSTIQPFAGYSWDAMLLLDRAAGKAKQKAEPGTAAFRAALRDVLQDEEDIAGVSAVYHYTRQNHNGVDERARVLVVVKQGRFRLLD